jgi:hypothetical protein
LFLALIETYVLELDRQALRPALRSLLLCLLPGLEEENSDDFERTLRIIDGLKAAVRGRHKRLDDTPTEDGYFWQCLFFAGVSSSSRRQGLLTFLVKRMPSLGGAVPLNGRTETSEDDVYDLAAQALITPEPGLLIRCFVAGLNDDQLLVQRGYLDLLLSHLPLHSSVLVNNVDDADMELLVGAATTVVARRDMSLNRRLWSWLLGPQAYENLIDEAAPITPSSPSHQAVFSNMSSKQASNYFQRYGSGHLIRSLLRVFANTPQDAHERARPFRLCLSLLDRHEIGSIIIPHIFVPALRNIYAYRISASSNDFKEVLKSAHSFFDGIESGVIWQQLVILMGPKEHTAERKQTLETAIFTIEHFNVREEDMLKTHVPLALLYILATVTSREIDAKMPTDELHLELVLSDVLAELLSNRPSAELKESSQAQVDFESAEICDMILNAYAASKTPMDIFTPWQVESLLVSQSQKLLSTSLQNHVLNSTTITRAKIVTTILSSSSAAVTHSIAAYQEVVRSQIATSKSPRSVSFNTLLAITQVVVQTVAINGTLSSSSSVELPGLVAELLEGFWDYLTPTFPKYQLETVRCMWQLDDLVPEERLVEASLAASLSKIDSSNDMKTSAVECARRFAVLWTHTTNLNAATQRRANSVWSRFTPTAPDTKVLETKDYGSRLYRPLLLLLDSCRDVDSEMGYFVRNWLETLPNVRVIFHVLLEALVASAQALPSPSTTSEEARQQILHQDRRAELLYYLEAIISILRISSEHMWAILVEHADPDTTIYAAGSTTLLESLAQECLQIVQNSSTIPHGDREDIDTTLQRTALSLVQHLIRSPEPAILHQYHLEDPLIQVLMHTVEEETDNSALQVALLDTITAALELQVKRPTGKAQRAHVFRRTSSLDAVRSLSRLSTTSEDKSKKDSESHSNPALPALLVKCVQAAIASSSSHHVLDNWISFLTGVLPLYTDATFQNMIPLVDSFCSRIRSLLDQLDREFRGASSNSTIAPEPAIISLLSGLEYIISTGHERMLADEQKRASTRLPEPTQGFFGNVVSGVFAGSDSSKGRATVGNARLTIILCFQDALRVCLVLWGWGEVARQPGDVDGACIASFTYMSQRLRNRARRILDRMFADEPLECLESIIISWLAQQFAETTTFSATSLLQVLDAARPKRIIPALFNSIYSRTSPTAIDAIRASSLTSDLTDVDLGQFLVDYTQSLDADAMDEIWNDCMSFLKDVLTNPLPHHNILPYLLIFLVILGEKIEGTNFGEQRKMRKDLAVSIESRSGETGTNILKDSFMRLLTAMFTTRSSGALIEPASAHFASTSERERSGTGEMKQRSQKRRIMASDLTSVLNEVLPRLSSVVNDNDRLISVISNISTNILSPIMHAKAFPENLRMGYMQLWLNMTKTAQASKIWRKDIVEALNHNKLFSSPFELVRSGWLPLFEQVLLNDKERLSELAARILAPASAGNIFGVGASAARLDSDKKTQLNVRRMTLLLMSADKDYAISSFVLIEDKITDLITASVASSPSSATRAEVFMLIRALLLKTSYIHLASLWPIITAELQRAIASALPRSVDYDLYNGFSLVQACKLLDLLLVVAPDDFQIHEWLFITDTIEAVYRPGRWDPIALIDDMVEELGPSEPPSGYPPTPGADLTPMTSVSQRQDGKKAPSLRVLGSEVVEASKPEIVMNVLRPWFSQLSIQAFETTYGMLQVDWIACEDAVLRDLFDDVTLVG